MAFYFGFSFDCYAMKVHISYTFASMGTCKTRKTNRKIEKVLYKSPASFAYFLFRRLLICIIKSFSACRLLFGLGVVCDLNRHAGDSAAAENYAIVHLHLNCFYTMHKLNILRISFVAL